MRPTTDRYEDWISNKRPLSPSIVKNGRVVANPRRDAPEDADPASRNGTLVTGQVENNEVVALASDPDREPITNAVHTATDIPLTATGPGALQFVGVQDNTTIFFKMMRAYGGSYVKVYYDGPRSIPLGQRRRRRKPPETKAAVNISIADERLYRGCCITTKEKFTAATARVH